MVIAVITALTVIAIILSVIKKPTVKIHGKDIDLFWVIALWGAVLLLASGEIPIKKVWSGLTENASINPIKVLVLFFSMTLMSVFLDEAGFFKMLASKVLQKSKSSQVKLFISLYLIVSVLTVFTSNDIIVLTFTPFIYYFCKNAKLNPVPYLFGEFVASNTFSMVFIIGNPTNIYLSQSFGIEFFEYLKVMLLPSLLSGIVAFTMLFILFHKQLKTKIVAVETEDVIIDKSKTAIGLTVLGLCTVLLAIGNYVNLEMWLISLCFAILLFVVVIIYNLVKKCGQKDIIKTVKRAPYSLIPFVISMFIMVIGLKSVGFTPKISKVLSGKGDILKYGYASYLTANVVNNIPMSVLFANAINSGNLPCVYASVIGSNVGAYLTPIGALAGIMWTGLLKNYGIKISFTKFVKYGIIISLPVMTVALLGLYIVF